MSILQQMTLPTVAFVVENKWTGVVGYSLSIVAVALIVFTTLYSGFDLKSRYMTTTN